MVSRSWRLASSAKYLAIGALLVSSAPAFAQDGSEPAGGRSAADAQRFLAQLLVRNPHLPLSYKLYRDGSHVSPVAFGGAKVVPASGDIVGVESPDKCTTRFGLEQAQIAQLDPGETKNFFLSPGISVSDFTVDWSKAGKVDVDLVSTVRRFDAAGNLTETLTEYPIDISMEGGWQTISFRLPNQDERARLALAIEVLKNSCRFQSDTGF